MTEASVSDPLITGDWRRPVQSILSLQNVVSSFFLKKLETKRRVVFVLIFLGGVVVSQ